ENARQIVLTESATLSVVVLNEHQCFSPSSDPVSVTVYEKPPKPVVSVIGEPAFCEGGQTVLAAPSGWSAYEWSNGENARQIVLTESATLSVVVMNEHQCFSPSSDPVTVTVYKNPPKPLVSIIGEPAFCEGGQAVLAAPPGWPAYEWSNGESGFELIVRKSGSYSVKTISGQGCDSDASDWVSITVYANPPQPEITLDGTKLISSSDEGNQWFLNGAAIEDALLSSLSISETGSYSVQVTSTEGCRSALSEARFVSVASARNTGLPALKLWPNPSTGLIFAGGFTKTEAVNYRVYNLRGEQICWGYGIGPVIHIDLSSIRPGVYVLDLKGKDRQERSMLEIVR
ncbi:MAG TPA: T9SS type A sorting domain-containing protein, partial [Prolixibacteraceae bacterium]|nr:T9SS type A sorting domain-containing protein [Prolixibacteraceae bacterium]